MALLTENKDAVSPLNREVMPSFIEVQLLFYTSVE